MKHSLHSPFYPHIDSVKFDKVVTKLREFFKSKSMIEVHTQNRLSILAACEDPFNVRTYEYAGSVWPLPQTGQMWLEHELLNNPEQKGYYCVSTSYRNERQPIEGRHCMIFPMFEFEFPGTMTDLAIVESELLQFLGFDLNKFLYHNYEAMSKMYGVDIIDSETEAHMGENISDIIFLMNFPERTNPFWNMRRGDTGNARKIDIILHGQETIGSAERSCDKDQMRQTFFSIEGGKYAQKLFDLFGYDRVLEELNEFLANDFFPRVGAGIGITRLIRAMELSNLI